MQITLIGMSGSGKSFWSKKLENYGFRRYCCDDLIEEKLQKVLKEYGYKGIRDVSKWMGQPFEPSYKKASLQYLSFEIEVMKEILTTLEKIGREENIVIDTTGSVIYTGKKILNKLAKLTKIIYLDTPPRVQEEMYQLYLTDPKPVIWGYMFVKAKQQTNMEALATSYPKLLAKRTEQYNSLAYKTLSYYRLRDLNYSINEFMEVLYR